ncbi:hypothetical protein NDI49_26180 [Trichocoleus sp. ST-U3]
MGIKLKSLPPTLLNQMIAARYERRHLLKTFWIGVFVLFLVELYTVQVTAIPSIAGAILIACTALYPSYLWCSGKALGMPIFPLFALTFLWTYALPLVSDHAKVITYSPDSHLLASITVAICLGLGTFTWFQFVKYPRPYPRNYRALIERKGENFFLFILAAGVFFNMYSLGGWFVLEGGLFALVRGAILGLNVLSVFVLSHRLGKTELSRTTANTFFVLLALYMISSGVSLVLKNNFAIFFVAVISFIMGRGKVPILTIIIVFFSISLLHYGKGEMRSKYWFGSEEKFMQPWEYPAFYTEWFGYSLEYLKPDKSPATDKKSSSLERSSVIHMLLFAQEKSPKETFYLYGKTYEIIPQLLIPRFINKNKIRSHEGTYILNIHYGLQTQEAALKTTIGWGLLAEAYANFGLLGCAGLGIALGAAYGQATRWSLNTPLLSSRSLFNVLLMSFAFQSEWTAGVYVAALFQASATLVGITFVFMRVYRFHEMPSLNHETDMTSFRNKELG